MSLGSAISNPSSPPLLSMEEHHSYQYCALLQQCKWYTTVQQYDLHHVICINQFSHIRSSDLLAISGLSFI